MRAAARRWRQLPRPAQLTSKELATYRLQLGSDAALTSVVALSPTNPAASHSVTSSIPGPPVGLLDPRQRLPENPAPLRFVHSDMTHLRPGSPRLSTCAFARRYPTSAIDPAYVKTARVPKQGEWLYQIA
jgi:hypothetical protein